MNGGNEILGHSVLSIGGTSSVTLDAKIATSIAVNAMASAVILSHNHPSGNPKPNTKDIKETERLKKALACFDISLLDHIVVSDDSWYSFAEEQTHKAA